MPRFALCGFASLLLACSLALTASAQDGSEAGCLPNAPAYHPDLFYNYYVWNNNCGVPAKLYVSPLPVPQRAGHTYISYQPLMPHEMLYHHHRSYYHLWDDGGYTTAHVSWNKPYMINAAKGIRNFLRLPR